LERISKATYEILRPKYEFIFTQLQETGKSWADRLRNRLEGFLKEHICVSFNAGKYDINLAKVELSTLLGPKITFVIKNKTTTCAFAQNQNFSSF